MSRKVKTGDCVRYLGARWIVFEFLRGGVILSLVDNPIHKQWAPTIAVKHV